ncbi:MAG: tRNA pseudouridine(38-40) synthase TruA [Candidatus Aureabacteria bacterium]|nr:tRNA pseudouridine(38-40) synthase TruA [Candidatus Auribacterota bacterium]
MRKVKLTLEYDGTRYAGWQLQAKGETVQGKVEEALERLLQKKVRVHGAGRTDAGAHALGQVAHFQTSSILPLRNIRDGTNSYLPPDIAVLKAEEASTSFHARYSAKGKIYRYFVVVRPVRAALLHDRAWRVEGPLNMAAMRRAAKALHGRHDFSAFTAAGSSVKEKTRTLKRIAISRKGVRVEFELEADGFLYKMVRNIVGTLILVGQGKMAPAEVGTILASGARTHAGPPAPAKGLYLVKVSY